MYFRGEFCSKLFLLVYFPLYFFRYWLLKFKKPFLPVTVFKKMQARMPLIVIYACLLHNLGEVHDKVPEHVHQLLQEYIASLFVSQQELHQMLDPVCLHNVRVCYLTKSTCYIFHPLSLFYVTTSCEMHKRQVRYGDA